MSAATGTKGSDRKVCVLEIEFKLEPVLNLTKFLREGRGKTLLLCVGYDVAVPPISYAKNRLFRYSL